MRARVIALRPPPARPMMNRMRSKVEGGTDATSWRNWMSSPYTAESSNETPVHPAVVKSATQYVASRSSCGRPSWSAKRIATTHVLSMCSSGCPSPASAIEATTSAR